LKRPGQTVGGAAAGRKGGKDSMAADNSYLEPILNEMAKQWPDNRTVNIVCHGHSVPSGYFATPFVNTFDAYPHLLHRMVKERFPFAVVNVIVTAVGGENSCGGAERFERDVLCHRPDLVTLDYALNDRGVSLAESEKAWRSMIEACLKEQVRVILMTPTWDNSYYRKDDQWLSLCEHCVQVRRLADEYGVGLADSFSAWERYCRDENDLTMLLSHVNHPTRKGHELVVSALSRYFIAK
jgi:acyl-CoA thioesterase-1